MGFRSIILCSLLLGVSLGDNIAQESYKHSEVLRPKSSFYPYSGCRTEYDHVSVVKQVPSFSKHCTKVEETKCKTVFKNSFSTAMETQCVPTFDTSCDNTIDTAYKQDCKIIKDIECRIVNLEDSHGGHTSKKICEDVPTEKCVPVPVKVEGQQCVNVPTQSCETVPVVASNPVPQKQCFKKPRKVCQTLVTTKPKVVTARIPKEVCGHEIENHLVKKSQTPVLKKGPSFKKSPKLSLIKKNNAEKVQTKDLKMSELYNKDYTIRRADDLLQEDVEERSSDFGNIAMNKPSVFLSREEANHFL